MVITCYYILSASCWAAPGVNCLSFPTSSGCRGWGTAHHQPLILIALHGWSCRQSAFTIFYRSFKQPEIFRRTLLPMAEASHQDFGPHGRCQVGIAPRIVVN